MKTRRLFLYFTIAAFFLGLATPNLSEGLGEEIKGMVTKIEDGKVTIKDVMGSEKTIEPKNPEALAGLKVGDQASVKDGILIKEGGNPPTAPSPGPRY
jgi:hypothetical protein